jgi:glycosyltransferase involved in cell wall biosynthesis
MKKHVLFIVQNNSFPSDKRVFKEALSLKEAGYEVSVISPVSEWDPERQVEFRGMWVFRYRNYESQGGVCAFFLEYANAVTRIFFLSLKTYFKKPFAAIHVANPPDFFWPMALFFKLFGVKFIYDQHDIAPEMFRANQGRTGLLYRLLLLNERLTVACSSAVVTVNQSLKQRMVSRYNAGRKPLAVVYNCPSADFNAQPDRALMDEYKGRPVVLFVGLMAKLDGVETLIRAAREIVSRSRSGECVFIFLGDGPEKMNLERMAKDAGLQDRVFFTGRVDYEKVKNYLSLADVCVAPDEKNEFTDHFTLVKVLEYMKAGKPFVGFRLTETCAIAGEAGCYADSFEEFVEKIEELLNNPELARRLGEKGREAIEKQFLWEHQEKALLDLYNSVLKGSI